MSIFPQRSTIPASSSTIIGIVNLDQMFEETILILLVLSRIPPKLQSPCTVKKRSFPSLLISLAAAFRVPYSCLDLSLGIHSRLALWFECELLNQTLDRIWGLLLTAV